MEINRETYSGFFLLYVDRELNQDEMAEVENFVQNNPDLHEEFELLQQAVMVPDEMDVFEDKSLLYRKEEKPVVPLIWWRLSAAAVVLIIVGVAGWLYNSSHSNSNGGNLAAVKPSTFTSPSKSQAEQGMEKKQEAVATTTINGHPAVKQSITVRNIRNSSVTAKKHVRPLQYNDELVAERERSSPASVDESVPSSFSRDMKTSKSPVEKEVINVPAPAFTASTNQFASPKTSEQIREFEPEENDRIYVANTSVSKRNRFRVVFRKASRMLEKVSAFNAVNDFRKTE